MLVLSKANAKNHCRTCLVKINVEEHEPLERMRTDPTNETKDICIRISMNNELELFLNKYTIEERFAKFLGRFPQYVCLDCFKLIQQASNFLAEAKANAKILYALINASAEDTEPHGEYDNTDKLSAKDSLMEVESVLFNTALENNEINKDDPFSDKIVLKQTQENFLESLDSISYDNDWEANSASEKNYKSKPITRSQKDANAVLTFDDKVKEANNIVSEFSKLQKKKRRSKQEMAEFRRHQLEKIANNPCKYKRRPKGTKNKFRCTQCDHRFAHQFTLDIHIRKIHEGNPRPYQCEHCPKTYAAMTGLTSHNQVEHSKERRSYSCDFTDCNRSYTCLMGLQNHKRIKHSDPSKLRKFICEKCGTTFWKKSLLIYHRRAKHPTVAEQAQKSEVYQCDICQSTLATKHSLKYHKIKYHSGEMKYKCDVCGQKLAQKSSVDYHKLLHSTEKVPCKDCGKQFVREYDLKKHIRVVHMKLKPYKCSYCPESFASNKTMKHHQFIHTGEKPYICNVCNKSYRQPTCLKNHLKSHEKSIEENCG